MGSSRQERVATEDAGNTNENDDRERPVFGATRTESCMNAEDDKMNVNVAECEGLAARVQKPSSFRAPLSFLRVGQHFEGCQHCGLNVGSIGGSGPCIVSRINQYRRGSAAPDDASEQIDSGDGNGSSGLERWNVRVSIDSVNLESGTCSGSMEARNVPSTRSPVVTYWDGEIVDNINFRFFTSAWDASADSDGRHWTRFKAFGPIKEAFDRDGAKKVDLRNYPYIFMHWKERFFVNVGHDCGLTIAGFYYVCLCRKHGEITGYYFDPSSSPYQKLELYAHDSWKGRT